METNAECDVAQYTAQHGTESTSTQSARWPISWCNHSVVQVADNTDRKEKVAWAVLPESKKDLLGKPADVSNDPPKGMQSKLNPEKDERPAISDKSTSIPGPSL